MSRRRSVPPVERPSASMPADFLIGAFDCAACATDGLGVLAARRRNDPRLPASRQCVPALDLLACPACGHSCPRHVAECGTCVCHNLDPADCPREARRPVVREWVDRG